MANNENNDSFEQFDNQSDNQQNAGEEKKEPADELNKPPEPRGRGGDAPANHQVKAGLAVEDGIKTVTQLMTEDAKMTKEALDKQPRVEFYLPLSSDEKLGSAYESVTINGYRMEVKKGMMVSVPKRVAEILAEYMNVQTSVGAEMQIGNKSDEARRALE